MKRRRFLTIAGGLALGGPVAASAQQPGGTRRLAIVHPSAPIAEMGPDGSHPGFVPFFAELQRLGYVEGRNLLVERYAAEGDLNRHEPLVRRAARAEPDVIFAVGGSLLLRLKEATSTIPVVVIVADPVALGMVGSLTKPGGNITGSTNDAGIEIWGKRLQLLKEIAPTSERVGFLADKATVARHLDRLNRTAERWKIEVTGATLGSPLVEQEYRRVFAELGPKKIDGLLVGDQAEHYANRAIILNLVAALNLPTVYPIREYVPLGGLISYGSDPAEFWRQSAVQVVQIFRGEKAGEIPFHQSTRFTLAVNLGTAAAQGVHIPAPVLARADEVIE